MTPEQEFPEITQYKNENGGNLTPDFFNNFRTNLPGGTRTKYGDLILNMPKSDPGNSEIIQSQTGYEFQAVCRRICDEKGITLEELDKLWEMRRYDTEAYTSTFLVIYNNLREMGYNHYDLTS